jgi:hypothetical protein
VPKQLRGVSIPAPPNPLFPQSPSPIPFSLPPRPSHTKLELSFFPYARTSIFRFTMRPKRGILLRHQFSIISFFREVKYEHDSDPDPIECIQTLVGQKLIYAFGQRTPGRKHIKPGDWICFYATAKGVVAHARVTSIPERRKHSKVRQPEKYPWIFDLKDPQLYMDDPVILDTELRSKLDAFKGRDLDKRWAWYVQATRNVTSHDFNLLTRQKGC